MGISNNTFFLLSIFIFPLTSAVSPTQNVSTNLTTTATETAANNFNDGYSSTDWSCPYWDDNWTDETYEQRTHFNEYSSAGSALRQSSTILGSNNAQSYSTNESLNEISQNSDSAELQDFNSFNQTEQTYSTTSDKNNHVVAKSPPQHQIFNLTMNVPLKKKTKTAAERAQNKVISNRQSQARVRLHNQKIKEILESNDQLINDANQKLLRGGNPEVILRQLLIGYTPTPVRKIEKRTTKTKLTDGNSDEQQLNGGGRNQSLSLTGEHRFDFVKTYVPTDNLFWTGLHNNSYWTDPK